MQQASMQHGMNSMNSAIWADDVHKLMYFAKSPYSNYVICITPIGNEFAVTFGHGINENMDASVVLDCYPYSELNLKEKDPRKMIRARVFNCNHPSQLLRRDLIILKGDRKFRDEDIKNVLKRPAQGEEFLFQGKHLLIQLPSTHFDTKSLGLSTYARKGAIAPENQYSTVRKGEIMTTYSDENDCINVNSGSENGDSGAGAFNKDLKVLGIILAVRNNSVKHKECSRPSITPLYRCSNLVFPCAQCQEIERCCPLCTLCPNCAKCQLRVSSSQSSVALPAGVILNILVC
jgi:hypothetical protein